MKITCQSCQSKYNVADEKVEGKIVKIRCRKCGATIVVNGTGGAAGANGASGADATAQQGAVGGADGTQWHVNVGDNDQRTLTLSELVDAYNAGVVTQDTFIWCDGMDDWRPLAEVEIVVSALHASANQIALGTPGAFEPQAPAAYEPPAAAPSYEPQAHQAPAYEAPAAAYAAPAPEPKRAAVAKREARARDLFATNAGEELQTSAPASPQGMAPAGDAGLTGQRNENSVLFSLAVLTKNAESHPASLPPTTANKEDSGLIDLKALAQKAESMRPMAMGDGDVFHAPLGLTPPPLGAPVGALSGAGGDVQPKSKLPLMIGGGAGVLVLLVLGIVIGVKIGGSGPAPVPTVAVQATTTATAEPSATVAAPTAEPSASAAPSATVATTTPKKTGPGGAWHPTPGAGTKPPGGSGGGSSGASPSPAPAPAPKKGGGDCGCNGDLMCLMKCSTH